MASSTTSRSVLLPVPEAYANDTPEGMQKLSEIAIENLNVLWPVSWYINGWTDYTFDQMLRLPAARVRANKPSQANLQSRRGCRSRRHPLSLATCERR